MRVKLTDICDIQYGYTFDSTLFSETEGTPLVRIRDVVRGFSETRTIETFPLEYTVHDGDILIGMDGEFNIARWHGGTAALNQRVCRLIPKSVDADYIFHYMPSALKAIEDKTPFVTVKHLSAKELNKITVPIPAPEVQTRIGAILNRILGIIDFRRRELQLLDNLIKARFVEMFEHRNYQVEKLGAVCNKITDGTHKTPTYLDDGITFISAKNIVNGELDFTDVKHISEDEYQEIQKRCQTAVNDILLSKSGSLGAPVIVKTEEKLGLFESLAVLKYDREQLLPEFLCEQLKTDKIQRQFTTGTKGVAIKHLHLGVIADTDIIVPPIDEQKMFAAFVAQVDKSKFVVQQALDKAQLLFDSLMQQYFG